METGTGANGNRPEGVEKSRPQVGATRKVGATLGTGAKTNRAQSREWSWPQGRAGSGPQGQRHSDGKGDGGSQGDGAQGQHGPGQGERAV